MGCTPKPGSPSSPSRAQLLQLEYLGIWRRKVGLDFTGVLSSFGDVPLSSTELSAFLNISGPRRKRRKLISSSEWPESEETGKNLTEGIGPAVTLTSRESSLCLGTSGHQGSLMLGKEIMDPEFRFQYLLTNPELQMATALAAVYYATVQSMRLKRQQDLVAVEMRGYKNSALPPPSQTLQRMTQVIMLQSKGHNREGMCISEQSLICFSRLVSGTDLQEDRTVQVPRFLSPSEGTTQEPWKAEFTKKVC
ncbi:putative cation-transporting ATPase 13A3 [Manis javanica]|nr:putative cation-transporting ATPase 13A3 [Manis javanica]